MTAVASDLVPSSLRRAVACAVWVTLAATGCGAADDALSAPELAGAVSFPRTLQADRWVEVGLDGVGEEGAVGDDWLITEATLHSGQFADASPVAQNKRLIEGYTARVRVPLGDVTCPVTTLAASVDLTLTHRSGDVIDATVPLPTDVLAEINATECAVKAVTDVASPSLGEPASVEGTVVTTTLTLAGGGGAQRAVDATLTDMTGSVIFELAPTDASALPLTLGASEDTVSIPVIFEATRCDPHAFAESKKTFVFGVWIRVGEGELTYVELRPGAELRAALQAAFEACR